MTAPDGGLWATVCEMALRVGWGVDVTVGSREALFAEELGVVLGVPLERAEEALDLLAVHGLGDLSSRVGVATAERRVRVRIGESVALDESVHDLAQAWDEVSWRISRLRDNPACADEEHAAVGRGDDALVVDPPSIRVTMSRRPYLNLGARPKVAILREQGVNSCPCRDRFRLRPGRFRSVGRPHDRSPVGSFRPRRRGGTGRLRRLLLWRHARRG